MANTFKFGNKQWYGKKGSVLAYNDENNNFKPLPFDFTRSSSATRVNKDGLIEVVGSDEPRVDYLNNADGHLLLEPSRTNYNTRSEEFDNGHYAKVGYSISANDVISPDGSQNADKVIPSATPSVNKYIADAATTVSSGASYTLSVFAKAGEYSNLRLEQAQNSSGAWFNISNGTVISTSGSAVANIEDYGNGWYRCSVAITTISTALSIAFAVSSSTSIQVGDGTSGAYLWGTMKEAGSYATSYIPTSGSSVTRAAETNVNSTPSGVIGQTEGTLYLEFEDLDYVDVSIGRGLSIGDGTSTNRIYISQLSSGAIYAISSTGCEIQESTPASRRGTIKAALAYKNNDYALAVNGVIVGTDTSATVPTCDKVYLGNYSMAANLNKPTKQVKLYDTRLTNAQLIALTS